jgi:hypothetical protein
MLSPESRTFLSNHGNAYILSPERPGMSVFYVGLLILAVGITILAVGAVHIRRGVVRDRNSGLGRTSETEPLPDVAVCDLCGTKNAADAKTCSFCGKHEFTIMAQ